MTPLERRPPDTFDPGEVQTERKKPMCQSDMPARFGLVARSYKTCEYGDAHETDCLVGSFPDPHALYRAAHAFYKKHESERLSIHITAAECK